MIYLKQSTASQSVLIGPFIDDTDGKTAETGLTISNTDIRLSKNGGNMAAKNSGGGTHDEAGWYTITLDATDTNTVGRLQISVHVAGALPVWLECHVLEEAIYDALFGASAAGFDSNGRVDVGSFGGTAVTARDIGAGVLLSPGTGTGQVSLSSGAVTVGTNNDKTGYSLTATTGLGNQTANITGNLSGSVGSVTAGVTLADGVAHGGSTATLELGASSGAALKITGTSTAGGIAVNTGTGIAVSVDSASNVGMFVDGGSYGVHARGGTAGLYAQGTSGGDGILAAGGFVGVGVNIGGGMTVDITGDITGNLSGSVGSVTGNVGGNVSGSVGSVAAGGITAASIATDAIDADALAADAVAEIADAVWDEVITGAQHNINTSAAKFLREASATITGATGTAQAGGTSTITLEAGASATDQLYQWERISIIDGTGVGQAKLIVDYNGTTKVATVNSAWAVQPDNTSVYAITGADVVVDAIDNQTVSATAAIDFDDLTTLATDWADGGRLDLILDGVSTLDAAGVRTAVGLAAANLDTQLAALQTDLDTVTGTGVTCVALTSAAVEDAFSTYTIAEAYHADGAAGTPAQLLYFTLQALTEFAISGTTVTVKKLDGSTTAGTFTLDDATTPTSRTRAT